MRVVLRKTFGPGAELRRRMPKPWEVSMWASAVSLVVLAATADPRRPVLERRLHDLAAGYEACFVLYDARDGSTLRVNEAECRRPCGR